MGQARHLLSPLGLLGAVLAIAMAGCGSSGQGSTGSTGAGPVTSHAPAGAAVSTCKVGGVAGVGKARVAGGDCPFARGVVAAWDDDKACGAPAGSSHASCSIGGLRCLGTATERGLAVSCAAPGRSISFLARRG
jgi:hypothetical protein